MSDYMNAGCAVHSTRAGFIAAVGEAFGRTLYRVHRRDDYSGVLVRGYKIAMAALNEGASS
jgi:hypothetical protein